MAHFAQINEENKVIQVITVDNKDCLNEEGIEFEEVGIAFCKNLIPNSRWIQTSYNNNFRGMFAGGGDYYHEELDEFLPCKPYPSWTLNNEKLWIPPKPKPEDEKNYIWLERILNWEEVVE